MCLSAVDDVSQVVVVFWSGHCHDTQRVFPLLVTIGLKRQLCPSYFLKKLATLFHFFLGPWQTMASVGSPFFGSCCCCCCWRIRYVWLIALSIPKQHFSSLFLVFFLLVFYSRRKRKENQLPRNQRQNKSPLFFMTVVSSWENTTTTTISSSSSVERKRRLSCFSFSPFLDLLLVCLALVFF